MKKTLSILLALMMLLLAVGCQKVNEPSGQPQDSKQSAQTSTAPLETSAPASDETEAPKPDETEAPDPVETDAPQDEHPYDPEVYNGAVGGGERINLRFIEEVYDMMTIYIYVGEDAYNQWNEEVFKVPAIEDRDMTPPLYQALQYFEISKEEFIPVLEQCKQTYGTQLEDWMLDALYADDMNTMLEALVRPTALYHDGVIYRLKDVAQMTLETCQDLDISSEKLADYVAELRTLEYDVWRKEYFNPIDALAESVASLTVVTPEQEVE